MTKCISCIDFTLLSPNTYGLVIVFPLGGGQMARGKVACETYICRCSEFHVRLRGNKQHGTWIQCFCIPTIWLPPRQFNLTFSFQSEYNCHLKCWQSPKCVPRPTHVVSLGWRASPRTLNSSGTSYNMWRSSSMYLFQFELLKRKIFVDVHLCKAFQGILDGLGLNPLFISTGHTLNDRTVTWSI